MTLLEHCELCHNKAVASIERHYYCKKHYIQTKEAVYLNNHNDLGILRWMKDMMPDHFEFKFASFHEDIVQQVLQLYDPIYTNRHQRQVELINYREAAKSHILTFGIPAYISNHNRTQVILPNKKEIKLQEELITIASDTGSLAEDFIVRLRDELTSNERLQYFYGGKIQDAYDALDGQWTRRAFKYNDLYFLGIGTGMQMRGRIKGRSRTTLFIADDIYDEDNVLTPESRRKIKIWFYGKALNSLDSVKGKAVLTGTILHDDTVLVECEKNDQWKSMKYYPMPMERFKDLIEKHLDVDYDLNKCRFPYDDIKNEEERLTKQKQYFDNLQNTQDWGLTWPERHSLLYFATKFKDAVQSRQIELMYQEYFHVTMSEAQKKFKPEYFQRIKNWEVFKEFGLLWFKCAELYDQPQHINIEFGIDLAGIGGTDNAVIQPVGALSDRRIIVFPAVFGKMHLRDGMYNDDPNYKRISKVVVESGEIMSRGIIDETFRLSLRYYPSMIKVGQAGEEDLITPQFSQLFLQNNHFIPIVPRKQKANEGSKHTRIINTCLPVYQTRMAYHCLPSTQIELELENLTKYPSDDIADACFASDTKILTLFGNKNIQDVKVNDLVYTPIGFKRVIALSKRKAKVINKFGFTVTPNHKFYNNNSFTSIDSIEVPLYFSKANIKELLLWKYKMFKYQILSKNHIPFSTKGFHSGEGREAIIFLQKMLMKENMLKDFMYTFGKILIKRECLMAIMFITKIIIHLITIPLIYSLWKLKNICDIIKNLAMKKWGYYFLNIYKKLKKKLKNGTKVEQEDVGINGIINAINISSIFFINIIIFVLIAVKSILIQRKMGSIVLQNVDGTIGQLLFYANTVGKKKLFEKSIITKGNLKHAVAVVQQNYGEEIKEVYNLQVEEVGCYYANGVLVSNCEVALWNIRYADPIKYETFTQIIKPRKIGRYNPNYNKIANMDTNDYFNLN